MDPVKTEIKADIVITLIEGGPDGLEAAMTVRLIDRDKMAGVLKAYPQLAQPFAQGTAGSLLQEMQKAVQEAKEKSLIYVPE